MNKTESSIGLFLLLMIISMQGMAGAQVVPALPRDIHDQLTTLGLNQQQVEAVQGIVNRANEIERQRQMARPPSSWSVQLPTKERFVVLADFKYEAVLDRETGLVWERSPSPVTYDWFRALFNCYGATIGGRRGWRLPTVEELTSLVDFNQVNPGLPVGHPFSVVEGSAFWSATTIAKQNDPFHAWGVIFDPGNLVNPDAGKLGSLRRWCVRGGNGHDGATHPFPP